MRKVAVVTGSRAEYGLLYWIIKGIHDDRELRLQLIVTGMHFLPEFGLTFNEIEKDGFPIAKKVEMLISSDAEIAIAKSMGRGITGFAEAYELLKPDILVVLGDRFEIFSAVVAAVPFRIPIAHIHAGEATEGVIDEAIRHAITKMSHIHFVSTDKYRQRVIQMGESPTNVFCFGSPGLDNIYNLHLMNKEQLCSELGLPRDKDLGVFTYHPVTLEKNSAGVQISVILEAIRRFSDIYWVFTVPNADIEGRTIIKKIKEFVHQFPKNGKLFVSLGQLKYLSLLKYSFLMIGNSSSGLIEAPSFKLPVVNIGDRQKGRIRGKNVIDVQEYKKKNIVDAINKALSGDFKNSLKRMKNPYGEGGSSKKIVRKIKTLPLGTDLLKKKFYEIK